MEEFNEENSLFCQHVKELARQEAESNAHVKAFWDRVLHRQEKPEQRNARSEPLTLKQRLGIE